MGSDSKYIEIRANINGEEYASFSSQSSGGAGETDTTSLVRAIQHPVSSVVNQVFGPKGVAIKQLAGQAISELTNIALMETNRYFSLKEDYLAQNSVNILKQSASNVMNIGQSAASYAMIGSTLGGPVGAVVGAVAGLTIGIAKQAIEKQQKIEQYQLQLNATNIQTSFAESRASLINGGRGTEN